MPLLSARWPAARDCLGRVAAHAAEANALIEDYIALDLKAAKTVGYAGETVLNTLYLQQLSEPRAKQVIRLWLKEKNLRLPSMKKLQALMNTLISSRYDAMPVMRWAGVEIRRFKHHIYAYAPKIAHDAAWSASWMLDADLILPDDLGILKALDYQVLSKGEALHIRFRQGGEVIRAVHHQGHTALKDLMQTWGIPPWERTRIPLIFKNNVLVAVHGYTHETSVCDLNKE
jgi:tRNA(Ile)-lysidine synthase